MKKEYDFSGGIRGKYIKQLRAQTKEVAKLAEEAFILKSEGDKVYGEIYLMTDERHEKNPRHKYYLRKLDELGRLDKKRRDILDKLKESLGLNRST